MLETAHLALSYQNGPTIHFPDCRLARGESLLLKGPSGCGKTTLLLALGGLMPPTTGTVRLHDTDIYGLRESQRDQFRGRHIGIVFQSLHLIKSLSVLQNVMLAPLASRSRADQEKAETLLDRLNILDLAHKNAAALSQGQAQRVAIARALMAGPSLLLADEPTSSLDDDNAQSVLKLLKDIAHENDAGLIVSSHDSRIFSGFDHSLTLEART
jgi:ABC-type lipoprotein export system ATPase subunit